MSEKKRNIMLDSYIWNQVGRSGEREGKNYLNNTNVETEGAFLCVFCRTFFSFFLTFLFRRNETVKTVSQKAQKREEMLFLFAFVYRKKECKLLLSVLGKLAYTHTLDVLRDNKCQGRLLHSFRIFLSCIK